MVRFDSPKLEYDDDDDDDDGDDATCCPSRLATEKRRRDIYKWESLWRHRVRVSKENVPYLKKLENVLDQAVCPQCL